MMMINKLNSLCSLPQEFIKYELKYKTKVNILYILGKNKR